MQWNRRRSGDTFACNNGRRNAIEHEPARVLNRVASTGLEGGMSHVHAAVHVAVHRAEHTRAAARRRVCTQNAHRAGQKGQCQSEHAGHGEASTVELDQAAHAK